MPLLMANATGQDSMLSNTLRLIQKKSAWLRTDILFGVNTKLPGHMTQIVPTKFNLENVFNVVDNQTSSNQV